MTHRALVLHCTSQDFLLCRWAARAILVGFGILPAPARYELQVSTAVSDWTICPMDLTPAEVTWVAFLGRFKAHWAMLKQTDAPVRVSPCRCLRCCMQLASGPWDDYMTRICGTEVYNCNKAVQSAARHQEMSDCMHDHRPLVLMHAAFCPVFVGTSAWFVVHPVPVPECAPPLLPCFTCVHVHFPGFSHYLPAVLCPLSLLCADGP